MKNTILIVLTLFVGLSACEKKKKLKAKQKLTRNWLKS
jgi:hypothetical protein